MMSTKKKNKLFLFYYYYYYNFNINMCYFNPKSDKRTSYAG